jgi:hypothetical protein
MQDYPSALSDRNTKLHMRALPAWKQNHDDVGTYHCISLTLPDGAQITDGDFTRIAVDAFMGPVVRVDVALAFQGLRDEPDFDDIPEARRNIEPFQSFRLLIGTATIVLY